MLYFRNEEKINTLSKNMFKADFTTAVLQKKNAKDDSLFWTNVSIKCIVENMGNVKFSLKSKSTQIQGASVLEMWGINCFPL